jgi:hypothetical protein
VSFDELGELLRIDYPNHDLRSVSHFNSSNADFNLSMNAADVNTVKDRFILDGRIVLDFKILAVIPGSSTMGVTYADEQDLITTEFSVTILDETAASVCANN